MNFTTFDFLLSLSLCVRCHIMITINIQYGEIEPDDIIFDSASLPYYILNTNTDIDVVHGSEKSEICFPNELNYLSKILNKSIDSIEGTDIIASGYVNSSSPIKFVRCPVRNNLLEYVNWYLRNIDMISESIGKENVVVEIPLLNVKYVYARLLPRIKNSRIVIFKSRFFNKYIDCLYMCKTTSKYADFTIASYNDFCKFYDDKYLSSRNAYLISMANAAEYIRKGNFYGYETSNYEKSRIQFIKNINK